MNTVGLSPKMVAATATSLILGVVVAVLNALQERPDLLGSLPPLLQFVLLAAIPSVVTGLAAYQAKPGTVE